MSCAAASGPDLVILDIMLPDSDGLEICKGLRNHSELAHVPIIFLTREFRKPIGYWAWNLAPTTIS